MPRGQPLERLLLPLPMAFGPQLRLLVALAGSIRSQGWAGVEVPRVN